MEDVAVCGHLELYDTFLHFYRKRILKVSEEVGQSGKL